MSLNFQDQNNANSYIKNIQMWILQNPQKSNISNTLLMMRKNQLLLLLSCMRSSWAALILNWNDIRALLGFKNRKSKWDYCLPSSLHPINLRNTVISHALILNLGSKKSIATFYADEMWLPIECVIETEHRRLFQQL